MLRKKALVELMKRYSSCCNIYEVPARHVDGGMTANSALNIILVFLGAMLTSLGTTSERSHGLFRCADEALTSQRFIGWGSKGGVIVPLPFTNQVPVFSRSIELEMSQAR